MRLIKRPHNILQPLRLVKEEMDIALDKRMFLQTINSKIISEPQSLKKYISIHKEIPLWPHLSSYVKNEYQKDRVRLTLFTALARESNLNEYVSETITTLLQISTFEHTEKIEMIFVFLEKLSICVEQVAINERVMKELIDAVPRDKYLVLYVRLLNLNIKNYRLKEFVEFLNTLRDGNEYEKYVYKTGTLNISDSKCSNDEPSPKLIEFLSYSDLRALTTSALRNNNLQESQLRISQLIKKFENHHRNDKSTPKQKHKFLQDINNILLYFCMVFLKNDSIIQFLLNNKQIIKFSDKMFITIISMLRKQGYLDSMVQIVALFPVSNMSISARKCYAHELLKLIIEKYPLNNKALMGYNLELFEDADEVYNDLGLLSLVFNGKVSTLVDTSAIPRATINGYKKVYKTSPSALYITYRAIFKKLSDAEKMNSSVLLSMFEKYITCTITHRETRHSCFSTKELDGQILDTFLHEAIFTLNDVSLADVFYQLYVEKAKGRPSMLCYAKMIKIELLYRNNYENAMKWMEEISDVGFSPTFSILADFVVFFDRKNEYEQCRQWYEKLSALKIPINHSGVLSIARKFGWIGIDDDRLASHNDSINNLDIYGPDLEAGMEIAKEDLTESEKQSKIIEEANSSNDRFVDSLSQIIKGR